MKNNNYILSKSCLVRIVDYVVTNLIVMTILSYSMNLKYILFYLFILTTAWGAMLSNSCPLRLTRLSITFERYEPLQDYLRMFGRTFVKFLPLHIIVACRGLLSLSTEMAITSIFAIANLSLLYVTNGQSIHDVLFKTEVLTREELEQRKAQPKPRYKNKSKSNDKVSRDKSEPLRTTIDFRKVKHILDSENVRSGEDFLVKVEKKKKKVKIKNKDTQDISTENKEDTIEENIS